MGKKGTKIIKKYSVPVVATDVAIFTIKNNTLQVVLIKMKKHPFEKTWALPGGLAHFDESLLQSAQRQLFTKTGVENVYLEQFHTFGEVDRDPFGRVVSVGYYALIPSDRESLSTTEEYGEVNWFDVRKLPPLAYDHKKMIEAAVIKLQDRLHYSNVAYSLLPQEFTLTELQTLYEIILGHTLDKRNFRKKILSLGLVFETKKHRQGTRSRPPRLYAFLHQKLQSLEVL